MSSHLQLTDDGSHTLFVPEIDECYHSTHGAIQESRHIFIEAALKQCVKDQISILEVGFGTGLNAFLALVEAERSGKDIHYLTLEKFPVPVSTALLLNYPEQIDAKMKSLFDALHCCNWNEVVDVTPYFHLEKIKCDFTQFNHNRRYDVIFFDAFSPEKQPEMWTEKQFEQIYLQANPGAILTTYCAKGVVRRAMKSAGFEVERLPGPPGKREILRAIK